MMQIAINTHNSVTTTIHTTSLRSSDGVLLSCLHVSVVFKLVSVLAIEILLLNDKVLYKL